MADKIYTIRGRSIGHEELETIRLFLTDNWREGRTAISQLLCRHWDWRQPSGLYKERACRVLLLKLEELGEIKLPPRMNENFRHPKRADRRSYKYDISELHGKVSEFGSLTIKMVRRSPDEGLWNHLVDRFHYLGKPFIVGSYLKYLAYLDDRLVACLGWGSAAWKVVCRDAFIGWNQTTRESNLHKIVNNVRFLIPPWVRVEHLASKVLAANIKVLQNDWQQFYQQPITLLETFVEKQRFKGTCYRAANWHCVGETKGRGKYDRYNNYAAPVKAVYLYPLAKNFKEALNA